MAIVKYRIKEVVNPLGRYISKEEFHWIMDYFRDPYDPVRLCMALMMTTGLRTENAVFIKLKDFDRDLSEIKVAECKAHVSKNKDVTNINVKWDWKPIPQKLSQMLRNYIKFRLAVGYYVGKDISSIGIRLFPTLRKHNLRQALARMRQRYGHKERWLKDVWMYYYYLDKDKNLISKTTYYRIACHATRAFYCTEALDICGGNLNDTRYVTNHDDIKNLQVYAKSLIARDKKHELRDKVMNPLLEGETAPFLKGQKRLAEY